MNAQHTPGPWVAGYGDAVGIGEVYGVGIDTEPDWTAVCMLSLSENVNETDEANARLIAAAPDLLFCLQVICEHAGEDFERLDAMLHLSEAKKAIAMATGVEA